MSVPRALIALALLVMPGLAAAQLRRDFTVAADIVQGCLVATAAGASLGRITLGQVTGVAGGTVEADLIGAGGAGLGIECTPGTALSVSADQGGQPAGGVRQLGLAGNAAARIPYLLFADGSATPWTTQPIAIAFAVGATKRLLPVRGRALLPGSQRAGTYTDTVRVTLAW